MILDDVFTAAIFMMTIIAVFIPVAATISTLFLWYVFSSDKRRPRSWLLFMLSVGSTVIDIGSVMIAYLAIRRLQGEAAIAGPIGGFIVAAAIVMIELVPIYFAVRVAKVRGFFALIK